MNLQLIYRYLRRTIKLKWHNYRNKRYWTKYYKSHRDMAEPSDFAKYCVEKYLNRENKNLLELGCGNGRDANYFVKNGLNVLGLDIVCEEINYLQKKRISDKILFKCTDFSMYSKPNFYDYIYSRFTIHAITEEQETLTLENSYKNLKAGGLILIEARSIKDEMFTKSTKLSENEGETDHYRRFLVFDKFTEKIKRAGFEIIEAIEAQGLAKYKDEDPFIIRVIAKK